MNKEILWNNIKKRWSISSAEKISMDHIIYKKTIQTLKLIAKDKFVLIYWPIENEVDTIAIIDELLKNKIKVCIPSFDNDDNLIPKKIESIFFDYTWHRNYKVPTNNFIVNKKDISIMIVPIVAFNNEKNFLEYNNYYIFTNFLLQQKNILSIGLAYNFQLSNKIKINNDKLFILDKIIID